MNAFVLFSALAVVLAAVAVDDVRADCWETGCQLNSWAVKGCAQYGRKTAGQRPCSGGIIYKCCTAVSEAEAKMSSAPVNKCDGETKCLPKKECKTNGCEPVPKKIVKKMKPKPCEKGLVYSCCAKPDPHQSTYATPSEENRH